MFRASRVAICLMLPCLSACLTGCVPMAVAKVATLPIKAASKTVDLATTSQSEADEKRGRELRRQEERLGKLERDYQRHSAACEHGESAACAHADAELAEIDRLGGTPAP